MATKCENGVFKLDNGTWGYRFSLIIEGRRVSRKKTTDASGNKLKTQKAAAKAREAAIEQAYLDAKRKQPLIRRTVKEVFEEYCEKGRTDRAYKTILKQDSLWKNHISTKYGKRFIDDISVAEINDYLTELYYVEGYSYQYTESFLKLFYLIFGQAYSRNYMEVDAYNKLCVNKDSRIKMPKMKSEDDTDIVAFSRDELSLLDEYFKGTNAETAYYLGRYCGLRINECYGLKWENIDLENGTIFIDRQMQYQDGLIKLVAPKTRNSKRTIYMNAFLRRYFIELDARRRKDEIEQADLRRQNARVIEDIDGSRILSTDLVNCLPNGRIQTVNSFKYPTREIKSSLGINFKFHYLRHTFGTLMAEMNTPQHLLCNQMGHGNIHVTQRYYIAISKTGVEILQSNLDNL